MRNPDHLRTGGLTAGTLAFVLVFASLTAHPASAQVVSGTVTDARSGLPVGSGFVVLLDRLENEMARTIWARNGSFSLSAPGAGVYMLRTERIGYRASLSEPFEVASTGVTTVDLAITALPIRLETIEVTREDRCRVSPEQNAETAVVWEEIRKALAAATWTESQGIYHTISNVYERDLDRRGRRVYREAHRPAIGYTRSPFVSRDPRILAEAGYIEIQDGGSSYFAPDAVVLQDEQFLQTHCFRLRRGERDGIALIGLAFEPAPGRHLPDVEGVLWLDRQTSELRLLEYTYTNLPYDLPARMTPGGVVEFLPLPGGAWVVHRWQIDLATSLSEERLTPLDRRPRRVVDRRREAGGEILTVSHPDGTVVYQAEVAGVAGVVFDSMSSNQGPLAGAIVKIAGTWFADTTDEHGRFALRAPLEGEYGVTFTHPSIDSVGFDVPSRPVSLTRGSTDTVTLFVPRLDDVLAELCPNSPVGGFGRVLVGKVRDSLTGEPVAGAQVAASWQLIQSVRPPKVQNRERVVTTEDDGSFVFCDLEFGRPAFLYSVASDARSPVVRVCFEAGGVEVGDEFHGTTRPIWRTDLTLASTSASGGVLAGVITNALTGDAIPGARVTVPDVDTAAVTDARGMFTLAGVPAGRQQITIQRPGYTPRSGEVEVDEDQPSLIKGESLALTPVAQVTGTIADAGTGSPVAEVWVSLLSDSGTAVAMTRTDELGRYAVSAPERGSYSVLSRRIGYSPSRDGPFELVPGTNVNNDIALAQSAYALEPVTVTAEVVQSYLEDVGFYQRQRFNASGQFMDREEIEEHLGRVSYVEELLVGKTGVFVGGGVPGSLGAQLDFQRGHGFSGGECAYGPRVYVDGIVVEIKPHISEGPGAFGATQYTTLSEVVRPEEVYAIEVYRTPSQIPIQYGGPQSACGVLLIWTIHGRR